MTTTQKKRGRPQSLPWDSEIENLVKQRREGATYTELADELCNRYNVSITAQAVRVRLGDIISREENEKITVTRKAERQEANADDATRVCEYLITHPEAGMRDVARALRMPLHRVDALMPLARSKANGYTIPTPKDREQQFLDSEMLDMLENVHDALGLSSNSPISQGQYAEYRDRQPERYRLRMPSALAFRRRFGTWTEAVEQAGLAANPLPRQYEGLTREDIVIWLAHWLRYLREQEAGLIEASQPLYRQWLRVTPSAPSEELIRMKGAWARILVDASKLERSKTELPPAKPVGTTGRLKKSVA